MNKQGLFIIGILTGYCLFSHPLGAEDTYRKKAVNIAEASMIVSTPAIGTALARADVALCRSIITPNIIKGDLGENIATKYFMKEYLLKSGNWQSVTPRFGRQGLDHVFIKYDSTGVPRSLMVAETKYGCSQLGMTKDGIQLGSRWADKRLTALANRYYSISNTSQIEVQSAPLSPRNELSLQLKNGGNVSFWRQGALDSWKYSGPAETLAEAKVKAQQTGNIIESAGTGKISYRKRLFNVNIEGDSLKISVKDAKILDVTGTAKSLPVLSERNILLKDIGKYVNKSAMQEDIARGLQSKLHIPDSDCREYAKAICNDRQITNLMKPYSVTPRIIGHMLIAGGIGSGIDMVAQILTEGKIDWQKVAFTGGVTAAGMMTGEILQMQMLRNSMLSNSMSRINMGSIFAKNLFAVGSAGIFTSALFSYGSYYMGYMDLGTANQSFGANTAGTLTGLAAGVVTTNLIMALGTASTGTAISSLSGAAATNATLAWLGGGSIASGGFGVAGGTIILTGGTAVVAILVTGAVMYGFHWKNQQDEYKRTEQLLKDYSDSSIMSKIVDNHYTVSSMRL